MTDSNETILGMIEDATTIDATFHTLFFTSSRIIIALTVSMAKVILSGSGNVTTLPMYWSQKRTRELAMMTPVEILQADKNNYYYPYTDIKSIILKKRRWLKSIVTITLDDGEDTFFFTHNFDEIFRMTSSSIPDKVIVQ